MVKLKFRNLSKRPQKVKSKLYFGKTEVPKIIKKTPKSSKFYPKMDQIWKLVREQNLEMKSYQSTLGDFKTSSLWPDCIMNIIPAQNNKI